MSFFRRDLQSAVTADLLLADCRQVQKLYFCGFHQYINGVLSYIGKDELQIQFNYQDEYEKALALITPVQERMVV